MPAASLLPPPGARRPLLISPSSSHHPRARSVFGVAFSDSTMILVQCTKRGTAAPPVRISSAPRHADRSGGDMRMMMSPRTKMKSVVRLAVCSQREVSAARHDQAEQTGGSIALGALFSSRQRCAAHLCRPANNALAWRCAALSSAACFQRCSARWLCDARLGQSRLRLFGRALALALARTLTISSCVSSSTSVVTMVSSTSPRTMFMCWSYACRRMHARSAHAERALVAHTSVRREHLQRKQRSEKGVYAALGPPHPPRARSSVHTPGRACSLCAWALCAYVRAARL